MPFVIRTIAGSIIFVPAFLYLFLLGCLLIPGERPCASSSNPPLNAVSSRAIRCYKNGGNGYASERRNQAFSSCREVNADFLSLLVQPFEFHNPVDLRENGVVLA